MSHSPIISLAAVVLLSGSVAAQTNPPVPASHVISGIEWHWDTRKTAALGSDLWPVTWGPDDNLYLAWGDGGGFGGGDHDGRVAMGIARIEGGPENFRGFNVNGGKNPAHAASFPKKGKSCGLFFGQGILYSTVNLQDGDWPRVHHALEWSADFGATWTRAWIFSNAPGSFIPSRFINFGKDGDGVPQSLAGFSYIVGNSLCPRDADATNLFLARIPRGKLREQDAYEYFAGESTSTNWTKDFTQARPVFSDSNTVAPAGIVYNAALGRYLLSTFHGGSGSLGIFEAPQPFGPWSTLYYVTNWGGMSDGGEGLSCEMPQKWMSADGLTVWCIFSVYGSGAKVGINAHDRFNLVKITLVPAKQ